MPDVGSETNSHRNGDVTTTEMLQGSESCSQGPYLTAYKLQARKSMLLNLYSGLPEGLGDILPRLYSDLSFSVFFFLEACPAALERKPRDPHQTPLHLFPVLHLHVQDEMKTGFPSTVQSSCSVESPSKALIWPWYQHSHVCLH